MLVSLHIRDFAIVDRIDVEFRSGMTVLTGETGAGKSILVDAVGLVLGDRGSSKLVRSGADRAEFSAAFDVSTLRNVQDWLTDNALDQDDECLLRRVINSDGRSRAFVNGSTSTASTFTSRSAVGLCNGIFSTISAASPHSERKPGLLSMTGRHSASDSIGCTPLQRIDRHKSTCYRFNCRNCKRWMPALMNSNICRPSVSA
jgi:energy-coupling factor transporter ATP-binding protein EcfA2